MKFWRNDSGAAAVEFGLVAPILAFALVTTGTMGGMVLAYNKMRQAVSSGAQYALVVGDDVAEIEDVVELAWDDMPASGASVSVEQACFCAGVENACDTVCTDNSVPQRITTITARRQYDNLAGISTPIAASQEVRTR
ncbi:MAG TPA: TadE/TadG family type IV pilus assembly protein [Caulobacteraceae bacterium]|nr:TadE/TadG family type IV pilus assembly protein [Caulobacteraceae bacterium]